MKVFIISVFLHTSFGKNHFENDRTLEVLSFSAPRQPNCQIGIRVEQKTNSKSSYRSTFSKLTPIAHECVCASQQI